MVWTGDSDSGLLPVSQHSKPLIQSFEQAGLRIEPWLTEQVKLRISSSGEAEWHHLGRPCLNAISLGRAKHLLGSGYTLTEFLIAPAKMRPAESSAVSSLGAIVNLMVVICDSLLDGGAAVETVLPSTELAAGGGDGSQVMVLLREFFRRLRDVRPDDWVFETAKNVVARMFEAEIETVRREAVLPYRSWLRKSSLPFAMMALPAWTICSQQGTSPNYLRWLYQVGRVFGAIDDAVDVVTDFASGHPNYWHGKALSDAVAARVTGWCRSILVFWDSLVPETTETVIIRSSFLYNVWRWLEPA